jgi:hypothetical protein
MRLHSRVRTLVPPSPQPRINSGLERSWIWVEERALLHSCMHRRVHPLPVGPSPIVLCLWDSEPSSVGNGTGRESCFLILFQFYFRCQIHTVVLVSASPSVWFISVPPTPIFSKWLPPSVTWTAEFPSLRTLHRFAGYGLDFRGIRVRFPAWARDVPLFSQRPDRLTKPPLAGV